MLNYLKKLLKHNSENEKLTKKYSNIEKVNGKYTIHKQKEKKVYRYGSWKKQSTAVTIRDMLEEMDFPIELSSKEVHKRGYNYNKWLIQKLLDLEMF